MSKNSIIDYCGYILFRLLGPIIRCLPLGFSLFLGRRLGDLLYYFDIKHKAVAYVNIKTALGSNLSPSKLSCLTKQFYHIFGQNLIEIFFIPLIDKRYLNKYISIEGLDYIHEGFKRGKGVILLGVHAGSWELSNIICANLGFPFSLFVREQRYPRLDKLLSSYRNQKGCRIIPRQNQTIRQLIQTLKSNQSIGMTADQGGRNGILVKFFGRNASMSTGAIKLALKYGATLIPAFFTRIKGPYFRIILGPIFEIKKTENHTEDIHYNLQEIIHIFERYIRKYPQEYLWTYKIWKYTNEKNILILSDGKTGHMRQSQAVAKIVADYLKDKGIKTNVDNLTIEFKQRFAKLALIFSSCLAGKYHCQGCAWCLKTFLREEVYKSLMNLKTDIVISCGSSIAPINYVISRENVSKSVVIMRPSILSTRRFDLVVMPRHDNPPKRKNIVVTEGALNLIDDDYLREQSEKLMQKLGLITGNYQFCIGFLIGGEAKPSSINKNVMLTIIKQVKSVSEKLNADILVTTSRRTSKEIEEIVKKELKYFSRCKLLVIANEKNFPETVGGILSLSQIIITSPESISMISEAVSSKKYVIVFNAYGLGLRHKRFLNNFSKNKYIHVCEYDELGYTIEKIWRERPAIYTLRDNFLVKEAIKRML